MTSVAAPSLFSELTFPVSTVTGSLPLRRQIMCIQIVGSDVCVKTELVNMTKGRRHAMAPNFQSLRDGLCCNIDINAFTIVIY